MKGTVLLIAVVLCLSATAAMAQIESQTVAAPATACLCTCSSAHHSSTEGYYEPPAGGGACSTLNTGACINQGERGTLSNCVSAPRPVNPKASIDQDLADFLTKLAASSDTTK